MTMTFKRYFLNFIWLLLATSNLAYAQQLEPTTTINLWSQAFLVSQHPSAFLTEQQTKKGAISQVAIPRIMVYVPPQSNHIGILVMSGGGYQREELGKEGIPATQWLVEHGFTVFNLIYRLPNEGWINKQVAFADGQRALRLIRQKSADYDLNKIGVMGFSAGGHLAGMLAVKSNQPFYPHQDSIDTLSARPDFAVLLYPVVSMLSNGHKTQSYQQLLGKHPTNSEKQAISLEHWVSHDTPPIFIAHAKDDLIAPVDDSIKLDEELKKAGIKQSLVLFEKGGHGWGLGKEGTPTATWTPLFEQWIQGI